MTWWDYLTSLKSLYIKDQHSLGTKLTELTFKKKRDNAAFALISATRFIFDLMEKKKKDHFIHEGPFS